VHHASAAHPLLERGIACLVEKPLAGTPEAAKELSEFAARRGAVLQVGHTERFNPAVRAVVAMKIRPRFMEVHRVSPMTFRSLDVGVVMDMMIHDLDIVLTLADSPSRSTRRVSWCWENTRTSRTPGWCSLPDAWRTSRPVGWRCAPIAN
jgi:predicted dehydrogenase